MKHSKHETPGIQTSKGQQWRKRFAYGLEHRAIVASDLFVYDESLHMLSFANHEGHDILWIPWIRLAMEKYFSVCGDSREWWGFHRRGWSCKSWLLGILRSHFGTPMLFVWLAGVNVRWWRSFESGRGWHFRAGKLWLSSDPIEWRPALKSELKRFDEFDGGARDSELVLGNSKFETFLIQKLLKTLILLILRDNEYLCLKDWSHFISYPDARSISRHTFTWQ